MVQRQTAPPFSCDEDNSFSYTSLIFFYSQAPPSFLSSSLLFSLFILSLLYSFLYYLMFLFRTPKSFITNIIVDILKFASLAVLRCENIEIDILWWYPVVCLQHILLISIPIIDISCRLWLSSGGGNIWLCSSSGRRYTDSSPVSCGPKEWHIHQLGRRVAPCQEVSPSV